ncbi:hypothetical protein SAMN05421736_105125 [Evansella caseinilytica]|uniref:Lipoprotein n=1 Tax=Evansella caseinilytica TaxID=1503961 RepID=A0A1H3PMP3_9BACI|nr:hypothetical protein [Evansella caseinilytica]SDZ02484.1 hypothetical protein SAMN05421736_105125 [Evansella caseinilytica]
MKGILPILLFLTVIIGGCTSNDLQSVFPSAESYPKLEKYPFTVETMNTAINQDTEEFSIFFKVTNVSDNAVSPDEFAFQWPEYVFDNAETAYQIVKNKIVDSEKDTSLEENEYAVELSLEPLPNKETKYIQIPFYITPDLYKDGYPFPLTEPETEQLVTGDLRLNNISIENEIIRFVVEDGHPEANYRHIAYMFHITEDKQVVYPLFTRTDSKKDGLHVELEFARKLQLPTTFFVQRTTVSLPNWRYSFQIPVS